jgi:outer membrane biosynthesis protein TonB
MHQQNQQQKMQLYFLAGFLLLICLVGSYKLFRMQKLVTSLELELTQLQSQVDELKQINARIPIDFTEKPQPVKKEVELRMKETTKKEEAAQKKEQKSASSSKTKSKKASTEKTKAKPETEKEKESPKEPTKDKPLIEKQD